MAKCDVCKKEANTTAHHFMDWANLYNYCEKCLKAKAHPYHLVVLFSLPAHANSKEAWWAKLVEDTLKHLGKTREQFEEDLEELDILVRDFQGKY